MFDRTTWPHTNSQTSQFEVYDWVYEGFRRQFCLPVLVYVKIAKLFLDAAFFQMERKQNKNVFELFDDMLNIQIATYPHNDTCRYINSCLWKALIKMEVLCCINVNLC